MMKKILIYIMVGLCFAMTVTGCSKTKKTDKKYNYKTTDLGTDEVTLTVVTKQGSSNGLSALKEAFESEYPNVTVEIVTNYSHNDLESALSDGDVDLFMGSYEYELWGEFFDDIWSNYAIDYATEDIVDLNGFNSDLLASNTKEGHVYALPLTTGTVGMITNMDLLKKCGIEKAPTTVEELLKDCAIIKQQGYQPFRCMATSLTYLVEGMTEYEVCKDKKNEDFTNAALQCDDRVGDYFATAADFLTQCEENGYIDTESEVAIPEAESNGGNNQAITSYMQECYAFLAGDVAFYPNYSDVLSSMQKRETRSVFYTSDPFTYNFVPVPTKYGSAPIRMAAYSLYTNKNSAHLDWAKKFIQFTFYRKDNSTVGNAQIFADAQYTMSPYDTDTVFTEISEQYYPQFHELFKNNNSCIANDDALLDFHGKGIYAGCVKYGFDVLAKQDASVDILSGAKISTDETKQKFVDACRSWFIEGHTY